MVRKPVHKLGNWLIALNDACNYIRFRPLLKACIIEAVMHSDFIVFGAVNKFLVIYLTTFFSQS